MTLDPTITKEIALKGIHGERRWFVEPFGTTDSVNLLSRCLDVCIGGGSRTLDQILSGDAQSIGMAAFFAGLGGLPARFVAAGGADLLFELLAMTEVEDPTMKSKKGRVRISLASRNIFDQVGRGNLAEVLKAAKHVVEVNWGPLFAEILDGLTALSATGKADSTDSEPETPITQSVAA
ncbi:MAG: hypothetical protein V3V34_11805 [Kiloniellales bacterium]